MQSYCLQLQRRCHHGKAAVERSSTLKGATYSLQAIETNARVYIIMEEASKGNLLTTVQELKRIPEKQSAIWFRQMCDAIDYCHQRGVVHRDLKCENLLIDHKV